MQEFKYNVFGNIRPSKVKTSISDDVDNPYLGKFMVRFCDGETAICSYTFPTEEDLDNDEWKPSWIKDSTGEKLEADDGEWITSSVCFQDFLHHIPVGSLDVLWHSSLFLPWTYG